MAINDQIRDEKRKYDINRKDAKIPALSSGKIDKYEGIMFYNLKYCAMLVVSVSVVS